MSAHLAPYTENSPPAVLVLGHHQKDAPLGRTLGQEGYQARFPDMELDSFEKVEQTLRQFRAETAGQLGIVHPGTSFWAEKPEVFHCCQRLNLTLLSPSAKVLSLFGNRLNLLDAANVLAIPNLVLDFNPIYSRSEAERFFAGLNNPSKVVFKSVQRGRRGTYFRVMQSKQDLSRGFSLWLDQLNFGTGDAIFFPERHLGEARRVLLPFARHGHESPYFFPCVDTSLQVSAYGRHRRVIDICPAPHLSPHTLKQMQKWSEKLLEEINFVGVGSFDFLMEGEHAYLIDGLARLDSSYLLWQKVAGRSPVGMQLEAMNLQHQGSTGTSPEAKAAVQSFIYAEDPVYQLPRPGLIHSIRMPAQQTDAEKFQKNQFQVHYAEGERVQHFHSGRLATLQAAGENLEDCFNQLASVLSRLWIAGEIQSNAKYLQSVLKHPWIREGIFHASFLDEEFIPEYQLDAELLHTLALLAGRVLAKPAEGKWSIGGRLYKHQALESIHSGHIQEFKVAAPTPSLPGQPIQDQPQPAPPLIGLEGEVHFPKLGMEKLPFLLYPLSENCWLLNTPVFCGVVRFVAQAQLSPSPSSPDVSTSGETQQDPLLPLYAQCGGQVHALQFQPGREIAAHEPLILVSAFDQLVPHALPNDVLLQDWAVKPGQIICLGQILAWFKKLDK